MGAMTTEAVELLVAVLRSRGKHNSLHDITRAADALASITRERDAMREGLRVAQAYALPTLNGIIESNINPEIMATAQADKDLIAALVNGEGGE